VGEEPAFAVEPAAVADQRAVGPDDAMARDDDGDGVGAVGGADRANGGGRSDADGEVPVARCRPGADRPQRVPDATLEGRAGRAHGDPVERGEVSREVSLEPIEDRPRRIREGVSCRVGQGQAMRERFTSPLKSMASRMSSSVAMASGPIGES
jgi:hypothetical protein